MTVDAFGFGYALTVAAGGVMGYVKAQSVPSLAAGLVFGGLLCYGAYQVSQNGNNIYLQLGTSLFLTSLMGYRFINSGKFMPAGLVATISLVNSGRLSYMRFLRHKKEVRLRRDNEAQNQNNTV